VECTINGIGERAGNAALEEIVMNLKTRADVYHAQTGVDPAQIYKTSRLLSTITGVKVQPNKAIVGENAFSTKTAYIYRVRWRKSRPTKSCDRNKWASQQQDAFRQALRQKRV
jgi:hypothetical protein